MPQIRRFPGQAQEAPITRKRWDEFQRNRRLAGGGNWTDGGHWMGSGPEPNAFDVLQASTTGVMKLTWPTDDCVEKFRQQSAEIAEKLGYGVAIVAALATRGRSWSKGLGAGLAGSWLLSRSKGIRVHKGWSYQIDSTIKFELHAHPWSRRKDGMTVSRVDYLRNAEGRLIERREASDTASLDGFSNDALFSLFKSTSETTGSRTEISCPDASVLLHSD